MQLSGGDENKISLTVERRVLAKRRWRGKQRTEPTLALIGVASSKWNVFLQARKQKLYNRSKASQFSKYLIPL